MQGKIFNDCEINNSIAIFMKTFFRVKKKNNLCETMYQTAIY